MKYTIKKVALFQAVGLMTYIFLIAIFINFVPTKFDNSVSPLLGISLFLSLFVISALISGSIILGYPLVLFFDGKKREAISIVIWSAIWLVVLFASIAAITVITLNIV